MPLAGQYPLGFLLLERYCWCERYLSDVTSILSRCGSQGAAPQSRWMEECLLAAWTLGQAHAHPLVAA